MSFSASCSTFPIGGRPELGELAALGVREVELRTADGLSLLAWYSAAARPAGRWSRISTAMAAISATAPSACARFARGGLWRADGRVSRLWRQPGRPDAKTGLYADGAAALDFLARRGHPAEPAGALRRVARIGCGRARWRRSARSRALILEAPFTSVAEVAQYHYSFVPASAAGARPFRLACEDRQCQGADPGAAWRARQGRPGALRPRAVRCGAATEGVLVRSRRPGTRISSGLAHSRRSSAFCGAGSADARAVDGFGDRVAILGVSLWATIPALAPEFPAISCLLWSTRCTRGRGRLVGGTFRGKMGALGPRQGRSIRTAPF